MFTSRPCALEYKGGVEGGRERGREGERKEGEGEEEREGEERGSREGKRDEGGRKGEEKRREGGKKGKAVRTSSIWLQMSFFLSKIQHDCEKHHPMSLGMCSTQS